jgi:hypothetical protein
MIEESTKKMTWHKTCRRYSDKLTHPSDAQAWTHFDGIHGDKAVEASNVRIALVTDGFNPFEITAAPHTCWPVFVIPLNLHPDIIFQRQYIFLLLVIPGYPRDNMSVYMEPLIDDLVRAWRTRCRHRPSYEYKLHNARVVVVLLA